jgi:hypothetical protein
MDGLEIFLSPGIALLSGAGLWGDNYPDLLFITFFRI